MAQLSTYLQTYKTALQANLNQVLDQTATEFSEVGPLSGEVWQHLRETVAAGKLMRGSLTALTYEVLTGSAELGIQLGTAWELFNTGILIHDDIIDQDRLRRGRPSTFAVYEAQAKEHNWPNQTHYGISMAVCVGDMCLFLANRALAGLAVSAETYSELLKLFARETIFTGFGEMKDTQASYEKRDLSELEIKRIQIEKTSCYTFVLPMVSAAIVANQPPEVISKIEELGNALGIVFQIKDDELGLFGSTEQIGKPAGSDIREAKQTLYYFYLKQLAEPAVWQQLQLVFGKSDLTPAEITEVQQAVIESGAKAKVDSLVAELDTQIQHLITSLAWSESGQALFNELRLLQTTRTK